jgi:hypothetical protein
MSLYQVNKLLRDMNCSSALVQRYRTEPEAVLQQYTLTPEEQDAILGGQVRKLYDMGANPLLVLVYALATGKDIGTYIAEMNARG